MRIASSSLYCRPVCRLHQLTSSFGIQSETMKSAFQIGSFLTSRTRRRSSRRRCRTAKNGSPRLCSFCSLHSYARTPNFGYQYQAGILLDVTLGRGVRSVGLGFHTDNLVVSLPYPLCVISSRATASLLESRPHRRFDGSVRFRILDH